MVKGKSDLKCKHKDIEMVMTFCVVDTSAPPVIGLKGCINFGLIKLVLSVTETKTKAPVLEEFADWTVSWRVYHTPGPARNTSKSIHPDAFFSHYAFFLKRSLKAWKGCHR